MRGEEIQEMSNELNSFLFSTPAMTSAFSAVRQLHSMMRFEWALMCALEQLGIAESGSGAVLGSLLDPNFVDEAEMESKAAKSGNIAIPFVRQLTATVKAKSEAAARAIHLGATSQDVLDTALVLQMRDGLELISAALARLDRALVKQVRLHSNTLMMGRTWLQAGPPTTLGLKLAGTLAALRRHRERIDAAQHRAIVLQFGGAVGTLAALGARGGEVAAAVARRLDLREAETPWHTQRDSLVEMVAVLAGLTGTLAKFARDIALLMQSEVAEVSEGGGEERGGSSTMPHKHNPVACAAVIAANARMPGLATTMLAAMPQEHERGLGLWQAEWETVPEAFRLTAAALAQAIEIAEGLEVNEARMRANLDAALGLPMAEAVSTALAPKVGRSAAYEILRNAANQATDGKRHLSEVLKRMPEVTAHLSDVEIDRLLVPDEYLSSAQRFIAQVLGDADADR